MKLKLYNTLTHRKGIFKPLHQQWVGLYTCGPTVYNYVHIGNLRTYIFQDVLKRTLEHNGYRVRHIMNITDVDDKTIRGSQKSGETLKEFTRKYEEAFKTDLKKLNIVFPWKFTRATEHIADMIKIIDLLLKKGYAYEKNGSIYFDISEFKPYGRLAQLDIKGLKTGARADADEYAKDAVQDFVLWKAAKPGEPSWRSPFGKGRPGWHIECSAMSTKYLGQPFDIHTAAVDLIFPHHENEIAQAEAAFEKKFVRYFLHGEHLLVNGAKMAKSLGNILTLCEIEEKKISPSAFRYLVLEAHYRSKSNFTWESLESAQNSLNRLYDFVRNLKDTKGGFLTNSETKNYIFRAKSRIYLKQSRTCLKNFETAIFDDLNTPKAFSILWDLIRDYNKNPTHYRPQEILKLLYKFDQILGLGLKNIKSEKIPERIIKMAEERETLRQEKKWREADELRKRILSAGYEIKDSPDGPQIKKGAVKRLKCSARHSAGVK